MGYYCTVPQCTSLAGKTKNVKFHRFPRDVNMADRWNNILKRGKPYTKYSKVCSLHFTQADYNVTTMGQWKTLSKDAVPSQNLPKLNPDGTVMVIRKSRTIKYKDSIVKKEPETNGESKEESKWPASAQTPYDSENKEQDAPAQSTPISENSLTQRLQHLSNLANSLAPQEDPKREKQDANIQTDPQSEEDKTFSDTNSFTSEQIDPYTSYGTERPEYEVPKDYTKNNDDYLPQTNEEFNKEAEKYALERKTHPDSHPSYKSIVNYPKVTQEVYPADFNREYPEKPPEYSTRFDPYSYESGVSRTQQHMLSREQLFQGQIKQETDADYENSQLHPSAMYAQQQRIMQQRLLEQAHQQVKTEPDSVNGCDGVMQPHESPYYQSNGHSSVPGYYPSYSRGPGAELLLAKQNALAAHSHLWQNTKRPFFYPDGAPYNSQLFHSRYEVGFHKDHTVIENIPSAELALERKSIRDF